ncbi:MAG: response regulator [Defluviitaleaceae bacterium]|nr:response regulator [Defluviitaleaceae bacterium]
MRYLLVIDDEPNLADGLCHALMEALGDDIDVSKAYSGSEALSILTKHPIDLVITDVRMPDISGLDLLQEIHNRRIGCRVLIITGYDEFGAIHEAVKMPQTVGFLLKNEGDDEIIKAAKTALIAIEEDEKVALSLALAERQSKALEILLRERRLWHILGILPNYDESAAATTLAIDLSKPLLIAVVRTSSEYVNTSTLIWLEQQIGLAFGTYFYLEMSILNQTDIAWILQQRDNTPLPLAEIIRSGMLEVQSLLATKAVELSVAFISKPIIDIELPGYVHALRNILQNLMARGQHQQVIDVSADNGAYAANLETARHYVSTDRYLNNAKNALTKGNELEWETAFQEILSHSATDSSIITRLLTILIATSDALNMPPVRDISKLLTPTDNHIKLNDIGIAICRKRKQASKRAITDLITRIHDIIEKDLDSPTLSLTSIASQIHHNPSYLSRLYKQQTGMKIIDKINEIRIHRACDLLEDPNLKISDIAIKVGYASPSYFTFFFRKKTGTTPKEYRKNF